MKLVVVSGLSGAGKSITMDALEDLGYYCMDNLPVALLDALVKHTDPDGGSRFERVAVAIDARNPARALRELPAMIRGLADEALHPELVFLEADDATLIQRFSETRRKHPLTDEDLSLTEAIERERQMLAPVRREADICIDTSRTHVHQLRELVRQRIGERPARTLSLLFQSFGYKHGVPADADVVFDARCLPNPYWEPRLRPLTGKDSDVVEFLESEPLVDALFKDICNFLTPWIPRFEEDNRAYFTVAIGCTGGQHRSVYLVERLARYFGDSREGVLTRHREL
ncbi:MAG: RNase adapter RapZ [Gammaproteobacteria bacterium]|nr:MAG: RNase adapter RapZ [Gammaproteobacteria bacterium]